MTFTPASSLGPDTAAVTVSNFPAVQAVSGTVSVSNLPTQTVDGLTQVLSHDGRTSAKVEELALTQDAAHTRDS